MTDDITLVHDVATVPADATTDDGGIDWDEQTVVQIDNEPWIEFFGTDTFYKFTVTAARPIHQEYTMDGREESIVAKKPAEELKKAQWRLDNTEYVLGHPRTGVVTHDTEIHGFARNPRYVELDGEPDEQRVDTFVPTNDETAKDFIDQHRGVSVGFFNELDWDVDESGVDAYQRNLTYDHLAGVARGRCSIEDGCGFQADSATDDAGNEIAVISPVEDHTDCSPGPCSCGEHVTVDAPDGIYTVDGEWFAVAPDEHTKERTDHADDAMFPVAGCADVDDAWQSRGHTDNLTITQDTLADRIARAGRAQDCDGPWNEHPSTDSATMTDDKNDDPDSNADGGGQSALSVSDLTVDALAAKHDGVAELIQRVDSLETERDSARERADALEATVLDHKQSEYEATVDELTDLTDHWDEDDLKAQFDPEDDNFGVDEADAVLDDVRDKLELAKELVDTDADDAGDDAGDGVTTDSDEPTTVGDGASLDGEGSTMTDGPVFAPETASAGRS